MYMKGQTFSNLLFDRDVPLTDLIFNWSCDHPFCQYLAGKSNFHDRPRGDNIALITSLSVKHPKLTT